MGRQRPQPCLQQDPTPPPAQPQVAFGRLQGGGLEVGIPIGVAAVFERRPGGVVGEGAAQVVEEMARQESSPSRSADLRQREGFAEFREQG